MKQFFPAPLPDHARNIMRSAGYGEQRTKAGQISYVKRVSGGRFPRYHAYVEETDKGLQVNLHVDQKEASYAGTSAHGGQYEGPLVEAEMDYLATWTQSGAPTIHAPTSKTKNTPPSSDKYW